MVVHTIEVTTEAALSRVAGLPCGVDVLPPVQRLRHDRTGRLAGRHRRTVV
ncbi:hypothetical protein [Streptomyces abikoensis]|uniref:hypothetical protein n=1 Tax=Streptomyces abikoensis TaxID=97398 RepID=UPI0036D1247D